MSRAARNSPGHQGSRGAAYLELPQVQVDVFDVVTTQLGVLPVLSVNVFYVVEQYIREGLAQIFLLH